MNNNNNNQNDASMNAFNFYVNNFLSSDEGRKIVTDIYGDSDISKALLQKADMHKKIMSKHFAKHTGPMMRLALNDEQPIVPNNNPPIAQPSQSMQKPVPMSRSYRPFTG